MNIKLSQLLEINKEELDGTKQLIFSALSFSLMTVCVKQLKGEIPFYELVFARALISLLITRFMLYSRKINPWGKNKGLLLLRGVLGTGALLCIFKALELLPLASATILQYSYPTFTTISAWIFLKEKINKLTISSVLIGWFGIFLIIQPKWLILEGIQLSIGSVSIAILGALLTALAYICVRKLSSSEDPLVIVHYFPFVSVPLTLPLVINNGVLPIGSDWIYIIGIGIFTQIGQIAITNGLKILPAAKASSINYCQVLFATIWGIFIFSEEINEYLVIGAIFILIATLISVSNKVKIL